jgi:hypothetical protein
MTACKCNSKQTKKRKTISYSTLSELQAINSLTPDNIVYLPDRMSFSQFSKLYPKQQNVRFFEQALNPPKTYRSTVSNTEISGPVLGGYEINPKTGRAVQSKVERIQPTSPSRGTPGKAKSRKKLGFSP